MLLLCCERASAKYSAHIANQKGHNGCPIIMLPTPDLCLSCEVSDPNHTQFK